MARYIDADVLKERLEDFSKWCRDGRKQGVDFVLDCPLPNMPIADVVQRAEVAREIFEDIEKEITDALKSNYKVLPKFEESEALWNKVNGKINALSDIEYFIAELKKKYTEEKK